MKLSRVERWILANQFRILEALDPAQADGFKSQREVLEHGYELEYDWIAEQIYRDDQAMPSDDCREVMDILDMFSFLKRGFEAIGGKPDLGKDVAFPGFDGNTEGKQLGYALHLRSQGKFTDLEDGDDFNSHLPVLERYRRMLQEWKASADRSSLTEHDIRRITSARG